jgi:threonine/homoserine/homoserine lactone efflux protein
VSASPQQIKQTRQTAATLSLVGMVIGIISGFLVIIFGVVFIVFFNTIINNIPDDGFNIFKDVTSSYGIIIIVAGVVGMIPGIIFHYLFKKAIDDNKTHIVLCVLAIIFGGIFNIIASILFLVNNNSSNSN